MNNGEIFGENRQIFSNNGEILSEKINLENGVILILQLLLLLPNVTRDRVTDSWHLYNVLARTILQHCIFNDTKYIARQKVA